MNQVFDEVSGTIPSAIVDAIETISKGLLKMALKSYGFISNFMDVIELQEKCGNGGLLAIAGFSAGIRISLMPILGAPFAGALGLPVPQLSAAMMVAIVAVTAVLTGIFIAALIEACTIASRSNIERRRYV